MIMSDKNDALGKYKKTPYPALEKMPDSNQTTKLVKSEQPYVAAVQIKAGEPKEQFRIYDKDGGFDFHNYNHLLAGSLKNGILILTTSTQIYTLTGKNLNLIASLIGDKKIRAIYEFNPTKHKLPKEDAAVIESIEIE